MHIIKFTAGFSLIVAVTACSPIKTHHGFNASPRLIEAAEKHTLNKREVQMRFGPASFSEQTHEGEVAYYVSYTKERFAFFTPEIVERTVLALHFKDDILKETHQYGLKDGNVIDINTRQTPTYGKDLSAIQQLLSNVGRFNSLPGQNRNDGSVLGRIPGGL